MIYNLVQHYSDEIQLDLDMVVRLELNPNSLQLNYSIHANLDNLILPTIQKEIKRADNLWQNTCFEAFLKLKDSPKYLELNLSPFSAYNVYSFDDYRQGMKDMDIAEIKLNSLKEAHNYKFSADLRFVDSFDFEAISICAIIKLSSGETSHWAIKHKSSKPDFHLASSFIEIN
ncbi:MAG TPA: DOMON-like domain-containing protein [Trueperaceae bacterium]|nr:DOMON-like domain-containing protein [Trueperaceae bacterium]